MIFDISGAIFRFTLYRKPHRFLYPARRKVLVITAGNHNSRGIFSQPFKHAARFGYRMMIKIEVGNNSMRRHIIHEAAVRLACLNHKAVRITCQEIAGIAVCNTGHCHPKVVAAAQEQVGKLIHGQANIVYHKPMLDLVDQLLTIVPAALDTFFFSNSGAEAIEAAVKLARAATGRPASGIPPLRWSQLVRQRTATPWEALIRDLHALTEASDIIILSMGLPALGLIPTAQMEPAPTAIVAERGPEVFTSGPCEGLFGFRAALASLMERRGAPCHLRARRSRRFRPTQR